MDGLLESLKQMMNVIQTTLDMLPFLAVLILFGLLIALYRWLAKKTFDL